MNFYLIYVAILFSISAARGNRNLDASQIDALSNGIALNDSKQLDAIGLRSGDTIDILLKKDDDRRVHFGGDASSASKLARGKSRGSLGGSAGGRRLVSIHDEADYDQTSTASRISAESSTPNADRINKTPMR